MVHFKIEGEKSQKLHIIKYKNLGETNAIINIEVPGMDGQITISFPGRTRMNIEYLGNDGTLEFNKEKKVFHIASKITQDEPATEIPSQEV